MIARARGWVVAAVGLPLLLALGGRFVELRNGGAGWVGPLTLFGIVSPVIGYRLYAWQQERAGEGAGPADYLRATLTALSATGLAGVGGWGVHLWSGEIGPLAGLASHVLLAGALWPTEERLELFLAGGD